jgi:hypothetical protein
VMTCWHCPPGFYQPTASFLHGFSFGLVCSQIAASSTGRIMRILNCYKLRANVGRLATKGEVDWCLKASYWKLVITKFEGLEFQGVGLRNVTSLIHPYLELTHQGYAWGWLACRAVRGVCPSRLWRCLNWSDAIMLRGKGWRGCSEPYAYNSKDGGCVNDCDKEPFWMQRNSLMFMFNVAFGLPIRSCICVLSSG